MTDASRSGSTPRRLPRGRDGGPPGSGRRFRPGRGPSNPSAGRVRPVEDPVHVQTVTRGGGGRRRARLAAPSSLIATRSAVDRRSEPQPSGRRRSKFDTQRHSAEPVRVPEIDRRLDRHRVDGHASLWPHRGAAPRWPGARRGRRRRRTTRPRSCTTRTAGPGPPPGTWSSPAVASRPSRPRCCATAGCSWAMSRRRGVRPGQAGPGPSPGRWSRSTTTGRATSARPRCCATAGCSWCTTAAAPSCTTRTPGPGPPRGS